MIATLVISLIALGIIYLTQRKDTKNTEYQLKVQRLRADYLLLDEPARLKQYRAWLQEYAELSPDCRARRMKEVDLLIERDKKALGKAINTANLLIFSVANDYTVKTYTFEEEKLRTISSLLNLIEPPKGISPEELNLF